MFKVIDVERKGNLIRLYMGDENLKDWGGDDWDDIPYEHNAGTVYDEYVHHYVDITVDFNYDVYEPADDTPNSPYCKDDFKARKAPAVIITEDNLDYASAVADGSSLKIYYGDTIDGIEDYWGIRHLEHRYK